MKLSTLFFLKCAAIAITSFGLITGWLVGRSGPDSSVIATLLPALVAAIIPIAEDFVQVVELEECLRVPLI